MAHEFLFVGLPPFFYGFFDLHHLMHMVRIQCRLNEQVREKWNEKEQAVGTDDREVTGAL